MLCYGSKPEWIYEYTLVGWEFEGRGKGLRGLVSRRIDATTRLVQTPETGVKGVGNVLSSHRVGGKIFLIQTALF